MGLDANILQQIRNQILGKPDGIFGDLDEAVYLQQIINALLGQADGQFGNLASDIYLQRILTILTNVLASYPKGMVLKTGQLTSYQAGDDGSTQKGLSKLYTLLNTGQYSGTTNITLNSKTDVHSNNVAFDNRTGLMWSNHVSASIGPASDGKIPFTTNGNGEGIFAYATAANIALLSGYGDWRPPDKNEAMSIMDDEAPTAVPNPVYFPGWPTNYTWQTTSIANVTTTAHLINYVTGGTSNDAKTANYYCSLVRG